MANQFDISLDQGSNFALSLTAKDGLGNPVNLSGYSARGGIKYAYSSTGYLVELNASVDPSYVSGIINVSLTAAQTATLPITLGVFEVEVYNSNGYTFKPIRGYVDICPEVTN